VNSTLSDRFWEATTSALAVTEENNHLFPDRPVSERKVSISRGIINLFSPAVGGVPMCHGAGGLAGHVAFGARTGGSLIILGGIILAMALYFSGSVETIFKMFPAPVLGVILFMAGIQLALGVNEGKQLSKQEALVLFGTAAFVMWNIGVAFVFGVVTYQLQMRGIVKR
jgi:MFS superfamily sulfate permease-like transporter